MSRKAIELGTHGDIEATPQKRGIDGKWKRNPSGRGAERWRARAYYRGHDGIVSDVSRVAKSRVLAVKACESALSEVLSAGDGDVTATMPLVAAGRLWLAQIARKDSGLSARTIIDYSATFHRYIDVDGSAIRGLTLAQVNDPQRLRNYLQGVADDHGSGSAKITKSVLSSILGQAVNDGVLSMNASRQVRPVKAQTVVKRERDTRRAFTKPERDALVAYAYALASEDLITPSKRRKRRTTADMVAFMAGTGVRISEARLLRWQHVDLTKANAEIHGTKSASARRSVPLPGWLVDRLQDRFDNLPAHGLVFASPHLTDQEKVWDQSNSAKALGDVIKGAGYIWATPHSLRRTVATLLGEGGVPLAQIADTLGHADPAMTASVYLGRDFLGDKSALAKHL